MTLIVLMINVIFLTSLPMEKNSTSSTKTSSSYYATLPARPRRSTIEKLRQFARASFAAPVGTIILN